MGSVDSSYDAAMLVAVLCVGYNTAPQRGEPYSTRLHMMMLRLSDDDLMFEVESLKLVRRYLLKGMNDSIGRKSVKV